MSAGPSAANAQSNSSCSSIRLQDSHFSSSMPWVPFPPYAHYFLPYENVFLHPYLIPPLSLSVQCTLVDDTNLGMLKMYEEGDVKVYVRKRIKDQEEEARLSKGTQGRAGQGRAGRQAAGRISSGVRARRKDWQRAADQPSD